MKKPKLTKVGQRKKPKRQSRYSEPVQAQVIARRVNGQSERAIARDMGMARQTVRRITTDVEYREVIEGYRRQVMEELVPPSLEVVKEALSLEKEPEPKPPALKFKKIEVLDGKTLQKMLDDAYQRGRRAALRRGLSGLKAALATLGGSQIFVNKSQADIAMNPPDGVDKLGDRELDERIRETEQRLKKAQAAEGDQE